MSEPRIITADKARFIVVTLRDDGQAVSIPDGTVVNLARTVIDQAAQIERLQNFIDEIAWRVGHIDSGPGDVESAEEVWLHPGDLGEDTP